MATDRERREVALKLHGITPIEIFGYESLYECVCNVIARCIGFDKQPNSVGEFIDRLADLIEPKQITEDTSDGHHNVVVGGPGMSAKCGDCLWWSKAAYESMGAEYDLACGYCRRYPPYVVLDEEGGDGHGGPLMAHPMVYAGDEACGEFRGAR